MPSERIDPRRLELREILQADLASISAFPLEAWEPLWDWLTQEWGGCYPYVSQEAEAPIIAEIAHNLAKFCVMTGWKAEAALDLSALVRVRLAQLYGGAFIYIPRQDPRRGRDAAIYDEFTGSNILELSRKYRVSFSVVYKAIHRERARRGKELGGKEKPSAIPGAETRQECA